jgi:hypothetical protein
MTSSVDEVVRELETLPYVSGDVQTLEELMERLRGADGAERAVGPILRFLETHPDDDVGAPGPLVHFVEKFYRRGYEAQLVDSVQRSPTLHSLWMLNRLINGSKGREKARYRAVMKAVAQGRTVRTDVRALADEFLAGA